MRNHRSHRTIPAISGRAGSPIPMATASSWFSGRPGIPTASPKRTSREAIDATQGTRRKVRHGRRRGGGMRRAGRERRYADGGVAMTGHAVVIAGGGPTGMMLAGGLTLAGGGGAIVERPPNPDLTRPGAGGPHPRPPEGR